MIYTNSEIQSIMDCYAAYREEAVVDPDFSPQWYDSMESGEPPMYVLYHVHAYFNDMRHTLNRLGIYVPVFRTQPLSNLYNHVKIGNSYNKFAMPKLTRENGTCFLDTEGVETLNNVVKTDMKVGIQRIGNIVLFTEMNVHAYLKLAELATIHPIDLPEDIIDAIKRLLDTPLKDYMPKPDWSYLEQKYQAETVRDIFRVYPVVGKETAYALNDDIKHHEGKLTDVIKVHTVKFQADNHNSTHVLGLNALGKTVTVSFFANPYAAPREWAYQGVPNDTYVRYYGSTPKYGWLRDKGIVDGELIEEVSANDFFNRTPVVVPTYKGGIAKGSKRKISSRRQWTLIKRFLPLVPFLEEKIKSYEFERVNIKMNYHQAVIGIHAPIGMYEFQNAAQYLKVNELFDVCWIKHKQYNGSKRRARKIEKNSLAQELISNLPFSLTASQQRIIKSLREDHSKGRQHHSVIQGDVATGKTLIALSTAANHIEQKHQVAILIPNVLVVDQMAKKAIDFFGETATVRALNSSVTAKQKKTILEELKNGECDLVIGTQSLLSDKVTFKDLSLVIVDEEHLVGSAQKAQLPDLRFKGYYAHSIKMSATPLPLSLWLTLGAGVKIYHNSDTPASRLERITTLDNKPNYDLIESELDKGHVGFVIAPAVRKESGMASVEDLYKHYSERYKGRYKVGFVHGKMKAKEKIEVLKSLDKKEIDILVASSVVNVGIDIGLASFMVVHDADRLGSSMLHQLRGRVGRRAGLQGYFHMVSSKTNNAKLLSLVKFSDGLSVAEQDLKLRGVGDVLAEQKQSGFDNTALGSAIDMDVLEKVSKIIEGRLEVST